jgi:hypothetical protein
MEILVFFAVIVLLTVFPVMIAAKMLGAENSAFFSCLLVVIASVVANKVGFALADSQLLANVIAIAFTALCISMILGAKYFQSLLISLLSIGLQFVIAIALTAIGFATLR